MSIAHYILKTYYGLSEKMAGQNSPTVWAWIKSFFPTNKDTGAIAWCSIGMIKACQEMKIDCGKQNPMAISWTNWGKKIGLKDVDPEKSQVIVLKRKGGNHVGTPIRYAPAKGVVYVLGFNQGDACNVQAFAVADVVEVREMV